MKDNLYEQRSYSFEIRAEQNADEVGVITGRPIVYNSKTDLGYFDEVIERGALNGTYLKDGLHPNEKGQNLMARMIISSLKSHYIPLGNGFN